MTRRPSARRKGLALLAASATTLTGSALLLGSGVGIASSHREAPGTLREPLLDNTDVYAFASPDKSGTTTLISNWDPFQDPSGGPNFYPFETGARYEINIDNNGDAKPDITYRWTFKDVDKRAEAKTFLYNNGPVSSLDDENLLFKQTYTLERIAGTGAPTALVSDAPAAPSNVGNASIPDYKKLRDEAIVAFGSGGKTYAGQADDPFFLDLRIFDLLYGGDLSETGVDSLDGKNINTIALQVPTAELVAGAGDPVIGVWSTTSRPGTMSIAPDGKRTTSGDFVQVSRLGNPLVNEVVLPIGLKDAFNSLKPEMDGSVTAAVDRVKDPEVPKLIEKIYGIPAPAAPRDDLVSVFLTGVEGLNKPKGNVTPAEMLRLNTSIPSAKSPNRLGVLAKDTQGFPNGRRLTDDVVDIELQALEGAVRTGKLVPALAKGDGVNSNDKAFEKTFPYIALPHSGSVGLESRSGGAGSGSSPKGGVGAGAGGTANVNQSLPATSVGIAGLGLLLGAAGIVTLRRSRRNGTV